MIGLQSREFWYILCTNTSCHHWWITLKSFEKGVWNELPTKLKLYTSVEFNVENLEFNTLKEIEYRLLGTEYTNKKGIKPELNK